MLDLQGKIITGDALLTQRGRIEKRALTASRELKSYVTYPDAEQVFQLEREFTQMNIGKTMHKVVYGITSLTAKEAGGQEYPWASLDVSDICA